MRKSRLGARKFLHLRWELDGHLAGRRLGIRPDPVREMAQGVSDSEEEEDPEVEVEGSSSFEPVRHRRGI
ncbi:hypothetical protein ACFX1X_013064 [Malus domestica]